ncbi:MAG: zinc metallopeptidase [Bacteroidaceae bacterium]|nr:zinc metallopeptidase [Bacteroidaceae bacterium]
MRLEGRRESSNVDDRRGKSTGKVAGGLGLGGLVIVALFTLLRGGGLGDVLQQVATSGYTYATEDGSSYQPTAEDEELAKFASQILAGTEDVWTAEFKKYDKTYRAPKLVLFSGSVQSGCGGATSSSGPFYCSADESVYIDLDFFKTMKRQFGTAGDFAYAYVIAHEVGHHVQNLLGTLSQAHSQMARVSQTESNQISVRLELQADFYAGVWAYNDNKMFGSLEAGDVEEGLAIAAKIGDDYLQKQTYGRTQPETFNHGTSAQRQKWLKKGLTTGDVRQGDTFSPAYSQL